MKRLAAACLVVCLASTARSDDELSFRDVDRRIVDQLNDGADVTGLAESLAKAQKTTVAAELLRRFIVRVRAGHAAGAIAALDDLRGAKPPIPASTVAETADFLIDRGDRALAVALLDRFPAAEPGYGPRLLVDWARDADWETADDWAAARGGSASTYWLRARLQLRARHGKAAELFDALVADAKAHADDVERFKRIVDVRREVSPEPDVAWIADVFRPRGSFDAATLGQLLRGRAAVTLLERALATPATADDLAAARRFAKRYMSMPVFVDDDDHWRAWLRASIRMSLLGAYRQAGDAQKAQALMVAIADESSESHGLPAISLFLAGQLQADSGAREIEGRVRRAEPSNENSPEYWTGRADYFAGRGEKAQAIEAFDRALALTPFDKSEWGRYFLILGRAGMLERGKGFAYLHDEVERMPDDAETTTHVLTRIADDYRDLVAPDDARIWRYLASKADWNLPEEKLLVMLVDERTPEQRDAFWKRARSLARDAAPSRSAALGDVAYRQKEVALAAELLASAVERLPDGDRRTAAAVRLFEAVRDLGDWTHAEATWPLARRGLTGREQHAWLGGLAVAQARAGDADAAMSTWARAVNLDRGDLTSLKELARAETKTWLVAFYGDLLKRDPDAAAAVGRALVVVGE